MIDFPTLFPSLVKYIPNWMEKFYPRIAQFARGEGYPCGNKGVFIPRRNKCWTHPKTGNRLKQPLTYQKYQEAKEKSQKSRTEKGRTALANREQSFRDKAREKVKGWQKNKPQEEVKPTPQVIDIPSVDKPINFEETKGIVGRLINGDITAKEAKVHYERAKNSESLLKQDLGKLKKDELKGYYGGHVWSDTKKGDLVDKVYGSILDNFNLSGGVRYDPMGGKDAYRKGLDKAVDTSLTDENIQTQAKETRSRREARKAEIDKIKKAIDDPQTLEDFETKGKYARDKTLTTDQQRRYDQLVTDANKQKKGEELEQKSIVSGVNKEGIKMSLQKTTHTKKGHDLYVATLDGRVERNTYDELNSRAKQMGGYYSSYKGAGAIPGFQFRDEETANKFMSLEEVKSGSVEQKKEQQQSNNAERLRSLAKKTEDSANEVLNQDRLTNTSRRASMADSIESRAREDLKTAQTLVNIADASEKGEIKYLDKIVHKSQVKQLDDLLNAGHYARITEHNKNNKNDRLSYGQSDVPISDESIDYVKYPHPSIHKENALAMANELKNVPGLKKIAQDLSSRWKAIANSETEHQVKFEGEDGIKQVEDLISKAKTKKMQITGTTRWRIEQLEEDMRNHRRLQAMDITNDSELRTALREYNGLRGKKKEADPTKQLERDLIGVKIPGYFPTPDALADRLVDKADIKPGMKVLEPSAGKGSLVDAVRRKHSADDVEVTPIELDSRLNKILKAKGYNPMQEDFMESKEKDKYDRIVMNPPFENGQDMDHVRHAYGMLKPGGKMVAIMGEGGFFRSDKKSQDFRNWLDDKGVSETLPPGSFKTSDNPTGVNTRLVTIQKGSKPKSSRSELDPDEADILLQVRDRKRKKDFNSHLNITEFGGNNLRRRKTKIANFAKPGCCCDASKPLRRRKTKQTPRLKRRGTRYA
jgi:phospholipid N-methyltransferase